MKNVIKILTLAFCCFISCSEPNGFELLEKAKKNYTQNNLEEALVLFKKARQSDFGTCGFSYLEAFSEIDYFKIQIYLKQKEYKLARQTIDLSGSFGGSMDSLRIEIYKLEIGSDSLSNMIDRSYENVLLNLDTLGGKQYAIIPLINRVDTIKIEATEFNESYPQYIISKAQWIADFPKSKEYNMLKTNKPVIVKNINKTTEIKNYGHSRNENIEKDANIVLSKFDNYRSLSKRIWALPCQDSIPKIILKDQHIIRNIYPIAVCEPPLFHPKQKHFISIDNEKVYLNHFQNEINLDSLQFYFKNNFADYHNVDGYIKLTNYLVILEAKENINLDRVEEFLLKLTEEFDKLKTDKHLEILI